MSEKTTCRNIRQSGRVRANDRGFPARYQNRPPRLRRAIFLVHLGQQQFELTRSEVAVFQAALALGCKVADPSAWMYPKKATLAREAAVSESTAYRTLRRLADLGLIERDDQERYLDGTLASSKIRLTEKAINYFELSDNSVDIPKDNSEIDEQDKTETLEDEVKVMIDIGNSCESQFNSIATSNEIIDVAQTEPEAPVRPPHASCQQQGHDRRSGGVAGGVFAVLGESMTEGLAVGMTDGFYNKNKRGYRKEVSKYQSTGTGYAIRDGRTVPVELLWLLDEKGMDYGALFDLVGQAGKKGHFLNSFIELRKNNIQKLKTARDCYFYVRSLIRRDVDPVYGLQRRQEKELACNRISRRKVVEERLASWLRGRQGQKFVMPNGNLVELHERSQYLTVTTPEGRNTSLRVAESAIKAIEDGVWKRFERPAGGMEEGLRGLAKLAGTPFGRRVGSRAVSQIAA